MANTPQTRKRARQNIVRRSRNMSLRSAVRTAIKKTLSLISEKKTPEAQLAYQQSNSQLDRAHKNGLLHKNNVARTKSRLNIRLKALVLGKDTEETSKKASK